jgi:hypothetical protein
MQFILLFYREEPFLSSNAKFVRAVNSEDHALWCYELPTGGGVTLGTRSDGRSGLTTLIGTSNAWVGGRVLVYLTTAYRVVVHDAPPGSTAFTRLSDDVVKQIFPHLVAWLRCCINRVAGAALGAAAVAVRHVGQSNGFMLFGPEHRPDKRQAFTSFNAASLVGLDISLHDEDALAAFVEAIQIGSLEENLTVLDAAAVGHLQKAVAAIRLIVVAHNNRSGLDSESGVDLPLVQQFSVEGGLPVRPYPLLASARDRINHAVSNQLSSLFVDETSPYLARGNADWLQRAKSHAQIWASIAVEYSVCQRRPPDKVAYEPVVRDIYTSSDDLDLLNRHPPYDQLAGKHAYRLHLRASVATSLRDRLLDADGHCTLWHVW